MKSFGYAVLCVVVPVLWGLLVVWVAPLVKRLAGRPAHSAETAPVAHDDRV